MIRIKIAKKFKPKIGTSGIFLNLVFFRSNVPALLLLQATMNASNDDRSLFHVDLPLCIRCPVPLAIPAS